MTCSYRNFFCIKIVPSGLCLVRFNTDILYMGINIHTCTWMHTCTHVRIRTHMHMHTHTHYTTEHTHTLTTHTHAHTTQTQTHTYATCLYHTQPRSTCTCNIYTLQVLYYACKKDSTLFLFRLELRCVIAIIRHGDRTPKQKMKMVVTHERYKLQTLDIHMLMYILYLKYINTLWALPRNLKLW